MWVFISLTNQMNSGRILWPKPNIFQTCWWPRSNEVSRRLNLHSGCSQSNKDTDFLDSFLAKINLLYIPTFHPFFIKWKIRSFLYSGLSLDWCDVYWLKQWFSNDIRNIWPPGLAKSPANCQSKGPSSWTALGLSFCNKKTLRAVEIVLLLPI